MTEDNQNSYRNPQEVYQKVLSNIKSAEGKWKGLIKIIVDKVSSVGEIDGKVTLKNGSFMPGAGYKADVEYSFENRVMFSVVRDDKSIGNESALDEAVSTLQYFVEPLEFLRIIGDNLYTKNVSISGPILEKPIEEYEVVPEKTVSAEDAQFLEAIRGININFIGKRDIPRMRQALQTRFPDNYGTGQKNDLGRYTVRGVISEFKQRVSYIKNRNS